MQKRECLNIRKACLKFRRGNALLNSFQTSHHSLKANHSSSEIPSRHLPPKTDTAEWVSLTSPVLVLLRRNLVLGKVHGSLSRAGKVRNATTKVEKQDKKKPPRGRALMRMKYNRRFNLGKKCSFLSDILSLLLSCWSWKTIGSKSKGTIEAVKTEFYSTLCLNRISNCNSDLKNSLSRKKIITFCCFLSWSEQRS